MIPIDLSTLTPYQQACFKKAQELLECARNLGNDFLQIHIIDQTRAYIENTTLPPEAFGTSHDELNALERHLDIQGALHLLEKAKTFPRSNRLIAPTQDVLEFMEKKHLSFADIGITAEDFTAICREETLRFIHSELERALGHLAQSIYAVDEIRLMVTEANLTPAEVGLNEALFAAIEAAAALLPPPPPND